jgi:hypothetical protein
VTELLNDPVVLEAPATVKNEGAANVTTLNVSQTPDHSPLPCDEVLRIAHRDAEAAYGDLSDYRISLLRQQDGWHVDYEPTGDLVAGGGPHYVIDATTGQILSKRYEQ